MLTVSSRQSFISHVICDLLLNEIRDLISKGNFVYFVLLSITFSYYLLAYSQ